MSFQTSKDGTLASARAIASPNGIPFMYNSGDNTTAPSNETKITASDAAASDEFGHAVAVGSGRVVVGARFDDDNGSSSGSAYIYDLSGTQIAKITASDGAASDQFGYSVAAGSGRVVVGAYGDGSLSGSAYIFDLNGTQLAKITASDAAASDYFGFSVAVGSGRIVVGAYGNDDAGSASGSVYIFDLEGTQIAKITASDATGADGFGWSVAVGSGRIVVGAYGRDDLGNRSGTAYIFDLEGTQIAKILASDGAAEDYFGFNVAVGCGRVVVGAYQDDDDGASSGSAYIFDLEGTQLAKITASDGATQDFFGESVAVGNGRIVVGARWDQDNGQQSGSVYIFDLDGTQIAKITASDGVQGDWFGRSVAVGNGRVVAGADKNDDAGSASGSAYIYETPNVITPYDVRDWEYG